MQELNTYIIDKTELTALIVGGDCNGTLSKKDKLGEQPGHRQFIEIWS